MGLRTSSPIILMVAFGVLARFACTLSDTASSDLGKWRGFVENITLHGLTPSYCSLKDLNHPIGGVFIAMLSYWIGGFVLSFESIFRMCTGAADIVTAFLALAIARQKHSVSDWRHALYFISIVGILVSSSHGNTDSVVVCLVMLGVYSLSVKASGRGAGIAFAGASLVKVIPLLLVPALVFLTRGKQRRDFCLSFVGVFVGGVVLNLALGGSCALGNIFGYKPGLVFLWGTQALATAIESFAPNMRASLGGLSRWFVVLASLSTLTGVVAGRLRTAERVVATGFSLFVALLPSAAQQYLIYPAPFLAIVLPFMSSLYSFLTGTLVLLILLPLDQTWILGTGTPISNILALLAWLILVMICFELLSGKRQPERSESYSGE